MTTRRKITVNTRTLHWKNTSPATVILLRACYKGLLLLFSLFLNITYASEGDWIYSVHKFGGRIGRCGLRKSCRAGCGLVCLLLLQGSIQDFTGSLRQIQNSNVRDHARSMISFLYLKIWRQTWILQLFWKSNYCFLKSFCNQSVPILVRFWNLSEITSRQFCLDSEIFLK